MNCTNIKENISAYLDNELETEQASLIKEHLSGCDECAKELDELSMVLSYLNKVQSVHLPVSFDERLSSALKEGKADFQNENVRTAFQTETVKKPMSFKRKLTMVSSIAAIFVIGIFSITVFNNLDNLDNMANNAVPESINDAVALAEDAPNAYQLPIPAAGAAPDVGTFGTVQPGGVWSEEEIDQIERKMLLDEAWVRDGEINYYRYRRLGDIGEFPAEGEVFIDPDSADFITLMPQPPELFNALYNECPEFFKYFELVKEFLGDVNFVVENYFFNDRRGVHVFYISVRNDLRQSVEFFILHGYNGEVMYATE